MTETAPILESLRRPPVAPSDVTVTFPIKELNAGSQTIGAFEVRASPQPRHWAPSAGLRINNEVAFVTDTPYEPSSARLAEGVHPSVSRGVVVLSSAALPGSRRDRG
jgi:hypothetical protein